MSDDFLTISQAQIVDLLVVRRFGVGLVLWKLEEPELSSASEAESLSSSFLSYVASISPHSVWLSFSPRLENWVKRYRNVEQEEGKGKRAFVMVMASRTEDTIAASKWEGVDGVVAQGESESRRRRRNFC